MILDISEIWIKKGEWGGLGLLSPFPQFCYFSALKGFYELSLKTLIICWISHVWYPSLPVGILSTMHVIWWTSQVLRQNKDIPNWDINKQIAFTSPFYCQDSWLEALDITIASISFNMLLLGFPRHISIFLQLNAICPLAHKNFIWLFIY